MCHSQMSDSSSSFIVGPSLEQMHSVFLLFAILILDHLTTLVAAQVRCYCGPNFCLCTNKVCFARFYAHSPQTILDVQLRTLPVTTLRIISKQLLTEIRQT